MLLWLDIETTGFDPSQDLVLEVGAILTDTHLQEVSRFHRVVAIDGTPKMSPRVRMMHHANGLLAACAQEGVRIDRADEDLALWLESHCEYPPAVCGSHPEFERDWAHHQLPAVAQRLGKRNLDMDAYWLLLVGEQRRPKEYRRSMEDLKRNLLLAELVQQCLAGTAVERFVNSLGVPA